MTEDAYLAEIRLREPDLNAALWDLAYAILGRDHDADPEVWGALLAQVLAEAQQDRGVDLQRPLGGR